MWPLIGRDEELALVRQQLLEDGRSVVLVAPPGTGKTRLLQTLAGELDDRLTVVRVTGTASARELALGAVASLLPDDQSALAAPLDVFAAVRRRMTDPAVTRPHLLVVDDAQLLDGLSAALVHHLVVAAGVRVLVAARVGEPVEDAITALWRDGLAERVDLPPLGTDDVATLLRAVLGGPVEEATAWQLWHLTGGNPLSLHEVVHELRRTGHLVSVDGLWRRHGDVVVGTRLHELVELRLRDLDAEERRVVELLAVGEIVDRAVVERACAPAALGRLRRRGFVVAPSERRDALRLDHPLFGEVVRAATPTADRQGWCRVLAAATTVAPGDDLALLRRMTWQLDGGVPVEPEELIHASERATRRFDGVLGARFADAALVAGGGDHARLARAEGRYWAGRFADALADCAALESSDLPDDQLARLAMIRAEAGFWGLGRVAETDAALAVIGDRIRTRAAQQRITALRSAMLVAAGDVREASRLARPIAEDPDADAQARLRAVTAAGTGLAFSGDPQAALDLCEGLAPLGVEHAGDLPRGIGWVLAQWINALVCLGRFEEARALLVPIRAQAIADGDDEVVHGAGLVLGKLALLAGDLEGATTMLRETEVAFRTSDPAGYRPWCLGLLAQAAAQRGDLAGARAATGELDALDWIVRLNDHDIAIGRAWTAAAAGEITGPVDLLCLAAGEACDGGNPFVAGLLLHEALRIGGDGRAVVDGLRASAAVGSLPYHALFHRHAQALVDGDGAALEDVAGAFEAAGMLLVAAECAARAEAAYRAAGLTSRASRAGGRSDRLRAACPGARTPALSRRQPGPGLTRREREIGQLAGAGLSNHAIATRLGIGVRTVEGHLLRASAKLGVHDRRELADVLHATENA
jgi:DNA-binding CsgD family transcriptional regulator